MFFLPLCASQVQQIRASGDWQAACDGDALCLASTLFVIKLASNPQMLGSTVQLHRLLARLIMETREQPKLLINKLLCEFTAERFQEGVVALEHGKGSFLHPDFPVDFQRELLTTADGQPGWNYHFAAAYQQRKQGMQPVGWLTADSELSASAEQNRLLQEISANAEESIQVQGYAGTGKTWLLSMLLQLLPASSTLLVARNRSQARALQQRIKGMTGMVVQVKTLTELLGELDTPLASTRYLSKGRALSIEQLLDGIQLPLLPEQSQLQARQLVRDGLLRFAMSGDAQVQPRHIPRRYRVATLTTVMIWVAQIQAVWEQLCSATDARHYPLVFQQPLLMWKTLALHQVPLKAQYTHVVLDEAHDLAEPVRQVLRHGEQAVITMGDDYQGLLGQSVLAAAHLHQRYLSCSQRSSRHLDPMINGMLEKHSLPLLAGFSGQRQERTRIEYFSDLVFPTGDSCHFIVADSLDMLARLLQYRGRKACSLLASDFMAARDCARGLIQLRLGLPCSTGELQRFASWAELLEELQPERAAQLKVLSAWLDEVTRRSLSDAGVEQAVNALMALASKHAHAEITLVTLASAKNHEFHQVAVSDVFAPTDDGSDEQLSAQINSLYTACTRVQSKLWLPEQVRDFVRR